MRIYLVFILLMTLGILKAKPLCFSDNGVLPAACKRVSQDQEEFRNFRRDPFLRLFLENATEEEGALCLEQITSLELLKLCKKNDRVGNPPLVSYRRAGRFSPTTLRYAKIVTDLAKEFGPLDGMRVVEIGGGYGGLCTLLSSRYALKSYTLVDLAQNLELSKRYLRAQNIDSAKGIPLQEVTELEADLIISYLFFSECDRTLQTRLIDKVLSRGKAGFLICAPAHWKEIPFSPTEHMRVKPLRLERIVKELASHGVQARVVSEEPLTGKDHQVIIWKR